MVLSGSFLIGGWGDGEGGRAEDGFHWHCAGVYASSPTSHLVSAGPWSWEQPPRIRAVGPQCSRARLHDWLGRWHVSAPDYTSFCPKGPKPPSPCSLEHGSSWLITPGFIPLSLSQYFHSFPHSLSKISFPPAALCSSFFSLPLKFLSNFSWTHLYSCHVLLPFTAEIFIKLLFKPASSFTSHFIFPSTTPYIAKSFSFFHALNEHSSYSHGCSVGVLYGCMPRDEGLSQIFVAIQRYLVILFSHLLQIFQSWTALLAGKVSGIPIPCFQPHAGKANLHCQWTYENFLFAMCRL